MTKNFTSKDAKSVISKHQYLLDSFTEISNLKQTLKNNIINATNSIINHQIFHVLHSMPIEHLSKYKRGLRIKPLITNNITTMADLWRSSVYNIEAIKGISSNTAYELKNTVVDIANEIRSKTKIKLNADNKTEEATKLVKEIAIYKNSLQYTQICFDFLAKHSEQIKNNIVNLQPSANKLRWFFTSKIKKANAVEAYNNLNDMLNSTYNTNGNVIISAIHKIKSISDKEAWDEFVENNVNFFTILEEIVPGVLGTDDSTYGLPISLASKITDVQLSLEGLKCSLRRYQELGVKYILSQKRVLLGDEMGLGKTIQAIAVMVALKNTGATHFMVICPACLVTNWCREITKHSILSAIKIHGSDKDTALNSWLQIGGVAVTTYETTSYIQLESDFNFSLLVVDEAHYIKNPKAQRSINTKELCKHTSQLLFMTGTALENRVEEMISLISILQPEIAHNIRNLIFMSSAPEFREKVAPVYYRRKRDDVLTELPELIESKEWCTMSKEEEKIYEDAILDSNFSNARCVSWNIDDYTYSSKANRLKEIVDEAELEGRKIIVFSYFLETIRKISLFLGEHCLDIINGSVNPQKRQEIIDKFDKAPAGSVLVSQIQSGGTGLNIQSASVVVICEPQYKPSIENQAISRAYRMGQSRNVLVYRLLCENSIDEQITKILEEKQSIFNAFADKSVSAQQSLDIDDKSLKDVLSHEITRISTKRGIQRNDFSENDDNKVYYDKLMQMTYLEIVNFLLEKYGPVNGDYFVNERCKTKNKAITRTNEGLFIHHIDEDKAILLAEEDHAVNQPFSYQKADRLVYCNLLEHLLLHIKIAEEVKVFTNNKDLPGIGGAILIASQINDFFDGHIETRQYMVIATNLIKHDFQCYIKMLNYLWKMIQANPVFLLLYNKETLSSGYNGNIVYKVYNKII